MRLCDAREILQHVLNSEFHCNSRARITTADQIFEVLVLADELVLHGVPHHLVEQKKIAAIYE